MEVFLPRQKNRKGGICILTRLTVAMLLLTAGALITACQTPPKKNNASAADASTGSRHAAETYQTRNDAGRERGPELFSSSAERFGSDPRASRPALVGDTVWIAVVSLVVLVSGAALVSAARNARSGRSSRRRT